MGGPKKNVPEEAAESPVLRKSPRKRNLNNANESQSSPANEKKPRGARIKAKPKKDPPQTKVNLTKKQRSTNKTPGKQSNSVDEESISLPDGGDKPLSSDDQDFVISENEIMSIDSSKKIYSILKDLVQTKQDVLFQEYRKSAKERISQLENERNYLHEQLSVKQNTIDTLASQILDLRNGIPFSRGNDLTTPKKAPQQMYESPIRNTKNSSAMIPQADMAEELKTISFTFDMLELLTGVRVTNYEEDKEKFYFDIRQTDTGREVDDVAVSIDYRLVIKRKFEQTAEVTYIPVFLKNAKAKTSDKEQQMRNEHARHVEAHLPDYLCDNLKFPFNTLLQFYGKLVKALNKTGRSR